MSQPRIVVTGVGLVTSLGVGAAETMERVVRGERGFREVTVFSTEGYASRIAAEVPLAGGTREEGESRGDALARIAAKEALVRAAIDPAKTAVDLVVASSVGGMLETERELTAHFRGRSEPIDPARLACHPTSAPADRVDAALGPFSHVRTVCSACSSGAVAIGLALGRLRRGESAVVLAGGVDAMSRLTYAGFSALASLDPAGSRPFDEGRKGLTLGEGAAFLVLERESDAKSRGAEIIAEIAGFATCSEAFHITKPEPDGKTPERTMRLALEDAGLAPRDVGYVSAHGTGTPLNDAMEAHAIARLLGDRARDVPVSSQKAQVGHTLAAAGAVEAAITILAMARGVVPPNPGVAKVDPALPVRIAAPAAEKAAIDVAISSSFGFGGTDAALVLCRPGRTSEPRDISPAGDFVITGVATLGAAGSLRGLEAARHAHARDVDLAKGPDDPKSRLDPQSARRLDLASRYAVFLATDALADAGLGGGDDVGLVAGSAFASTDASAAFFARVEERGPRFAPPLDFPNLVPSSPGAHAAIVGGLHGPVLSVADMEATAIAALETSLEVLRAREAGAVVSLSSEAPSMLVDRLLASACSSPGEGPRSHGGAALVVELAEHAADRGRKPFARVESAATWRRDLPSVRAPRGRAEAVVVRADASTKDVLARVGWGGARLVEIGSSTGWHEAAAGIALAAAVARIARGEVDEALVVAVGRRRGGAALIVRA